MVAWFLSLGSTRSGHSSLTSIGTRTVTRPSSELKPYKFAKFLENFGIYTQSGCTFRSVSPPPKAEMFKMLFELKSLLFDLHQFRISPILH